MSCWDMNGKHKKKYDTNTRILINGLRYLTMVSTSLLPQLVAVPLRHNIMDVSGWVRSGEPNAATHGEYTDVGDGHLSLEAI